MSIQLQRNNGAIEEYFSYSEVLTMQTELAILAAQNADCIWAIENNKQTILDLQNELARTEAEREAWRHEAEAADSLIEEYDRQDETGDCMCGMPLFEHAPGCSWKGAWDRWTHARNQARAASEEQGR